MRKSLNATIGSHTALTNGDLIGTIDYYASTGTGFPSVGSPNASIRGLASGAQSPTSTGGELAFSTTQSGTITNVERMRIDHTGNVGIGTTSPAAKLHISGSTGWPSSGFMTENTGASPRKYSLAARTDLTGAFSIADETVGVSRFVIDISGNVGIGTTAPRAKLEVNGAGDVSIGNYTYLSLSGSNSVPCCAGTTAYSIWGSGRIAASEFNAFSDERIKNIKGKSNSTVDLDILKKLEVTDYVLKDVVEQSNKPQKKVIAQQVEKFYPQAVNISSEFIPNVYQPAFKVVNNGNGNYELAWEKGVPQESKRTDKIKLITDKGKVMATIIALDDKSAKIKTDEYIGEKVFVYGVEVSDFHSLDYEALSTLNISATQALSAQLEAQKAENQEIKAEIEALKTAVKALTEKK